ncbi:similar to Saccharomyces cerevisiae YDR507C GIN4 Protein kinase involved in bud growth and assembly of the septin ring, proposed to have kinase-dependent and kinase-independent activities [Maudiozyma barnettii]|uniref:non-specific serine/threonine protein kinase n=1 Tax=Maudiozyma barnettii TaxID=61262 RepID=A0A8H2VGI4_9SACH|nr:protein kinase GIN4 [Kazachstania barnettii]CAB4255236.1 similar to Saccharomyces cerevisiae YDR507C GIN4 Protein kinase involved in bud growth and assembly of the septin ring, proposed to have kinase-dependent and kinase-independent activities [Kazachstania barnettii]CAD1783644.1 similar to Saccharomyces cerevisiae YDR507C GIN4 Protein kinase involved in bud growth and assembly of the septin ring, proposed to have kinase-dependent and kinase-independent activities [Kazachstania barnettii]
MAAKSVLSIKGDQIGPWKLGETLGLGSTGKVHLAYNKSNNQHAAIKIISKAVFNNHNPTSSAVIDDAASSSATMQHTPDALPYGIEREIIIMKLLNHPNVLRLYDVWETNPNLYMVLEYAEKGELFNLLVERGPLPENEAITFFRQIIIGISYCHALGIVHRDLKPENLLLDHKYNIKIADFGMAALETEDKLLETSCGSPHYAAPEIVSGIPYHGFASDIWSCGVILFALLTGRLPFDEDDGNIRNLLLKVQSGQFEMPGEDECSKEAQDLLAKILVVDPTKRIKARDILKHPLLQKYPSIKDSKSIRNLPREDTYLNPLVDNSGNTIIDQSILQNLVVLWHGRDSQEISKKLRENGANAEKTLYALLSRFKRDTEQENIKNEHLRKRQSITNNHSPKKILTTGTVVTGNTVTPNKKNRISMISVASSHKRPVSYNRLSSVVHNTPTGSIHTTPKGNSANRLSMNKRISVLSTSNHNIAGAMDLSPTPASRNKRTSIIADSLHPVANNNNNRLSRRLSRSNKRLSFKPNMKRGSITTKLISTYAKLAEDDDWEYIEKETKRTSSDFATLIDEIFEHEKYEQIRKEKAELARKVAEAKKLEELERKRQQEEEMRRIKEVEKLEQERLTQQQSMDQEIELLKKDLTDLKAGVEGQSDPEFRSVSAPMTTDRGAEIKNESVLRQRNYSLQTRPKSRLDPGLFFNKVDEDTITEEVEEKVSQTEQNFVKSEKKRMQTEKVILETIRRSRFLGSSFDIHNELKTSQEQAERMASMSSQKQYPLPSNAVATAPLKVHTENSNAEATKISEINVPQFTRKSRAFSDSNRRLSVLSMYSTRQSFSNLVDILKNTETPGEPLHADTPPPSAGDSDALFEAVNEDAENTGNSSTEERGYEAKNNVLPEPKQSLKMSYADRYANNVDLVDEEIPKNELPKLPSLSNKANGLGIYQAPAIVEPHDVSGKTPDSSNTCVLDEKVPTKNTNQFKSMIVEDKSVEVVNTEPENVEEETVRKAPQRPQKQELSIPKQREENNDEKRKKSSSSMSFFRKFSNSNEEYVQILYATVSQKQMFDGLQHLLRGWTKYGLKGVKTNPRNSSISGKLANDNILSLRSTVFEIAVTQRGKDSCITIAKKSGSTKAVKRLSSEIEKVLKKENVLHAD